MTFKCMKRSEISKTDQWKIEDIFSNDSAWKEEYNQIQKMVQQFPIYQEKLGESPERLLEYFQLHTVIAKMMDRVYIYANQKYHEDTGNSMYQNFVDMAGTLSVQVLSAESFVEPEILELGEEKITEFLSKKKELLVYEKYLKDILKKKDHTLSAEIEEILAESQEMGEAPSNIFSMFDNADLKFPIIQDEDGNNVQVTHGNYISFMKSKNRKVRKDAFIALYSAYGQFKNTLGTIYASHVKKDVFYAKIRNYDSSIEMILDGSNIPISVYTNLIEVVHQNFSSMYRYMELRKKILDVDELHMYDVYANMVTDVDMPASFSQAKDLVYEGLEALGEEYRTILKSGFTNGWIDVYENEGKRSGAYSWGPYGTHPYVLLNYHENIDDIFTLAHEMGHALHSYYSDHTQPFIYAEYKIFVAEVASTCNEALLMHFLLNKTQDKKMKAYLINYYLEQFRGTLYRQTMFAEFELLTHKMAEEGKPLTADSLCELYGQLNQEYFGDTMMLDEEIKLEWARIPHFYESFYVYQYATGYSAAIALSQKILKEGKKVVDDYINLFLSGGSSKDPIDLLKDVGVDMSTKEPVEAALKVFDELVSELGALLS